MFFQFTMRYIAYIRRHTEKNKGKKGTINREKTSKTTTNKTKRCVAL